MDDRTEYDEARWTALAADVVALTEAEGKTPQAQLTLDCAIIPALLIIQRKGQAGEQIPAGAYDRISALMLEVADSLPPIQVPSPTRS